MWDTLGYEPLGWLFVELLEFAHFRDEYFVADEHYASFQIHLARNPECGDVLQGCGGLRKARWPDPRRGKGKRGGLRVIYLQVPEVRVIVLADVYDKDEAADLTPGQKRELAELARAIKSSLIQKHNQVRSGAG